MNFFKTTRDNYLLKLGAGIFSCTLIFKYILELLPNINIEYSSRLNIFSINPILLLFLTLFLMPIVEEFTFRGMFSKYKIGKYCFYILIPFFIWSSKNYFLAIFYVAILIIIFKNKKLKTIKLTQMLYFINSFLFAVVHYEPSDFLVFSKMLPILFQFSIGLVLIWVTINYKLVYSIFLHISINALIILPLFYILQNPNTELHSLVKNGYEIIWQKTPIFSNKINLKIQKSRKELIIENVTIYKFYELNTIKRPIYKTKKENELYHFNITIKNINAKSDQIDTLKIQHLLKEARLVQ